MRPEETPIGASVCSQEFIPELEKISFERFSGSCTCQCGSIGFLCIPCHRVEYYLPIYFLEVVSQAGYSHWNWLPAVLKQTGSPVTPQVGALNQIMVDHLSLVDPLTANTGVRFFEQTPLLPSGITDQLFSKSEFFSEVHIMNVLNTDKYVGQTGLPCGGSRVDSFPETGGVIRQATEMSSLQWRLNLLDGFLMSNQSSMVTYNSGICENVPVGNPLSALLPKWPILRAPDPINKITVGLNTYHATKGIPKWMSLLGPVLGALQAGYHNPANYLIPYKGSPCYPGIGSIMPRIGLTRASGFTNASHIHLLKALAVFQIRAEALKLRRIYPRSIPGEKVSPIIGSTRVQWEQGSESQMSLPSFSGGETSTSLFVNFEKRRCCTKNIGLDIQYMLSRKTFCALEPASLKQSVVNQKIMVN